MVFSWISTGLWPLQIRVRLGGTAENCSLYVYASIGGVLGVPKMEFKFRTNQLPLNFSIGGSVCLLWSHISSVFRS